MAIGLALSTATEADPNTREALRRCLDSASENSPACQSVAVHYYFLMQTPPDGTESSQGCGFKIPVEIADQMFDDAFVKKANRDSSFARDLLDEVFKGIDSMCRSKDRRDALKADVKRVKLTVVNTGSNEVNFVPPTLALANGVLTVAFTPYPSNDVDTVQRWLEENLTVGTLKLKVARSQTEKTPPKPLPPLAVPDPAPKLTIVSPAMDADMVGRATRAPDDDYTSIDCLQDSKTFGIRIAAQNWKVSAGGQGVLVVVDGVYAKIVHNLSKPVMVGDLAPYEGDSSVSFSSMWMYPMSTCGFHWIAVVPTAADGRMLPVPPVISWWRNVSADVPHTRDPEEPDRKQRRRDVCLPVVNWPLIGKPYFGTARVGDERLEALSGFVVSDPKRIAFDWALAPGTGGVEDCELLIGVDDEAKISSTMALLPSGTIILPDKYAGRGLALQRGGSVMYTAKLWSKSPPAVKRWPWPRPGSAKALDYWKSGAGQKQFRDTIRHEKQRCAQGDYKSCR